MGHCDINGGSIYWEHYCVCLGENKREFDSLKLHQSDSFAGLQQNVMILTAVGENLMTFYTFQTDENDE